MVFRQEKTLKLGKCPNFSEDHTEYMFEGGGTMPVKSVLTLTGGGRGILCFRAPNRGSIVHVFVLLV